MKSVRMMLVLTVFPSLVFAGVACAAPDVPEIGPVSSVAALALVSGALLVIRARRKR